MGPATLHLVRDDCVICGQDRDAHAVATDGVRICPAGMTAFVNRPTQEMIRQRVGARVTDLGLRSF